MVIIDWDADHDGTGDPHGLNRMECDLGAVIGSDDFPMPRIWNVPPAAATMAHTACRPT